MARFKIEGTALSNSGRNLVVLPRASIEVLDPDGNQTTLFLSETGEATVTNPFFADSENGSYSVWAAKDVAFYDVVTTFAGRSATERLDVILPGTGDVTEEQLDSAVAVVDASAQAKAQEIERANYIDVSTFGVLPSNTPAENDTALISMRDTLITAGNERLWRLFFPVGLYQFTDNKWSRGIKHLDMVGYGATLQNTLNDPTFAKLRLFDESTPFFTSGQNFSNTVTETGREIETLLVGVKAVTFKTPTDSSAFSEGDRVLLLSRDVQFTGFPPNYSKIQYNQVAAVSSGSVTLRDGASFDFRDDDPHNPVDGYGKARIINLDRGVDNYVYPETRILRGFTLKQNPNRPSPQGEVLTGGNVLWEDITFDGNFALWPSISRSCTVRRSKYTAGSDLQTEPDKIVENVTYEDFEFTDKAYAGSGIQNITMRRMLFSGEADMGAQRSLIYDGCKFAASGTGPFGVAKNSLAFAPGTVSFKGCEFKPVASEGYFYAYNGYVSVTAAPSAVPSSDNLQFTVSTTAGKAFIGAARIGSVIYDNAGTDCGFITDISHTATNVDVYVDWISGGSPTTGKTYRLIPKGPVFELGGNILSGLSITRGLSEYLATTFSPSIGGLFASSQSFNFTQAQFFSKAAGATLATPFEDAPRYVKRVVIDVIKAYSGADSTSLLTGNFQGLDGTLQSFVIDTKISGRRVVDISGNINLQSGESASVTGRLQKRLRLVLAATTIASKSQAPIVSMEIEYSVLGLEV